MTEDQIKAFEEKRQAEIAECEAKGHGQPIVNKWGDLECSECGFELGRSNKPYPRGVWLDRTAEK